MDDRIHLRFLAPAAEPPDGQSVITVDLSGFGLLAGRVGRDAALLSLLLRATRVRGARTGARRSSSTSRRASSGRPPTCSGGSS